jgi:hypothetical protein
MYQYLQGINVRKRASEIVNLLSSSERITAERQNVRCIQCYIKPSLGRTVMCIATSLNILVPMAMQIGWLSTELQPVCTSFAQKWLSWS